MNPPAIAPASLEMTELPEIERMYGWSWTGSDGRRYTQEVFELRGGDVAGEWLAALRVPEAPWCRVTIWSVDGAAAVSSFGGSVWPNAWTSLFESVNRHAAAGYRLTTLAMVLLDAARLEAAQKGDRP